MCVHCASVMSLLSTVSVLYLHSVESPLCVHCVSVPSLPCLYGVSTQLCVYCVSVVSVLCLPSPSEGQQVKQVRALWVMEQSWRRWRRAALLPTNGYSLYIHFRNCLLQVECYMTINPRWRWSGGGVYHDSHWTLRLQIGSLVSRHNQSPCWWCFARGSMNIFTVPTAIYCFTFLW